MCTLDIYYIFNYIHYKYSYTLSYTHTHIYCPTNTLTHTPPPTHTHMHTHRRELESWDTLLKEKDKKLVLEQDKMDDMLVSVFVYAYVSTPFLALYHTI